MPHDDARHKPRHCSDGYYFFGRESASQIRDLLNRGNVRGIKVKIDTDDRMTQEVLYDGPVALEGGGGPVNDSHRCPGDPACP